MLRKQRKVENADMNGGFDICVVVTVGELIKYTTQIADGTLRPVMKIGHLHFQVNNFTVIFLGLYL